ncbi:hypothetical protein DACRYDRAFT_38216, partial [Dacryopinax primogenitus]
QLSLSQAHPSHWNYLAEGSSSLVCTYAGPSKVFTRRVLRLRKTAVCRQPSTDSVLASDDTGSGESTVRAWQEEVIARLLPRDALPQLDLVTVDPDSLRALEAALSNQSRHRRPNDRLDLVARSAVLAQDVVSGESIAVEIKPKCGFLPSPVHLSPSTARIKLHHCRYCMHSLVRLSFPASFPSPALPLPTTTREHYCPLDFYSGDEHRVRRALEQLWELWLRTQGKGNNFRVFVRGERVDPADVASLVEALDDLAPAKNALIQRLLPLLLKSPILGLLKQLQRTLDPLDIDGLSALHQSMYPDLPLGYGQTQPEIDEWKTLVESWLAHQMPEEPEKKLRYYVLAYTLSATFKDCSLIVHLPIAAAGQWERRREGGGIQRGVEGKVWVVDTDVKKVSKLGKWAELDREIVSVFSRLDVTDRCVE